MRLQAIEQEVLIRKRLRPLIAELRAQAADYASTRGLSADERASVMIKAFMNSRLKNAGTHSGARRCQ
jgi:hypothetical protein